MQSKLINLRTKFAAALKQKDYIKAAKLQQEINALADQNRYFTIDSIINKMTEEERDESVILMNRIMTFSDILQGYAIDFENFIKKRDKSIESIEICRKAKESARLCLSITKAVSSIQDPNHVEIFQQMCDEIDICAQNIIYKYHQKQKRK